MRCRRTKTNVLTPISRSHPDREPKFRVKVDSTIDDKVKPHVYNDEEKKPMVRRN